MTTPAPAPLSASASEAATVAALVKAANAPLHLEEHDALVFPDKTIKNLEFLAPTPTRKRARVMLHEAASFIGYVLRFREAGRTLIFGNASEVGGSFNAIIDYHGSTDGAPDGPAWGEHVATLTLATTPEWQRWLGNNNKLLSQEQFAEFIEDNQLDIIRPNAGDVLDMAQLLIGKRAATFKSGKSLRTGALQIEYSETIEATNARTSDAMQIPEFLTLQLCPFVGSAGVEITARLRFRISDSGKLAFQYILNRPFKIIEDAFNATRAEISGQTGLDVYLGSGAVLPASAIG